MIKEFLMRKMIASKMKDVPVAEQEKIMGMITKDPEFFKTIAEEVQAKMKEGKDQMAAVMEVVGKHQDKLKDMMK